MSNDKFIDYTSDQQSSDKNQNSNHRDIQLREVVSHDFYEEVCQQNLKLLKQIDKLNVSQQKLLSENIKLKKDLDKLNKNLGIIDVEINSLEKNFKCLNKPLNTNLELNNFSIIIVSLLFLLFISLINNFLILRKENKFLVKGVINYR